MSRHLQQDVFPDYRVGFIHGKMTERKKMKLCGIYGEQNSYSRFDNGPSKWAIDVPRASLMVIEHAERFGLSQLISYAAG